MKLIIAGSREITDYQLLKRAVFEFAKSIYGEDIPLPLNGWIDEIISGAAKGVDTMGEKFAKEQNINLVVFHANWNKHGNAAGPIRNGEMGTYARIMAEHKKMHSALIAIPHPESFKKKSGGTQHMIKFATDADFDYVFVHGPENIFSMDYKSNRT